MVKPHHCSNFRVITAKFSDVRIFTVIGYLKCIRNPLAFQAARVNSVCNRIKKIALEIRVFGYKGSSLLELDSFLNFTSQARLRVS